MHLASTPSPLATQRRSLRITCVLHLPRLSLFTIESDIGIGYALCNDTGATLLNDEQIDRVIQILEEHADRAERRRTLHVTTLRHALAPQRGDA